MSQVNMNKIYDLFKTHVFIDFQGISIVIFVDVGKFYMHALVIFFLAIAIDI